MQFFVVFQLTEAFTGQAGLILHLKNSGKRNYNNNSVCLNSHRSMSDTLTELLTAWGIKKMNKIMI